MLNDFHMMVLVVLATQGGIAMLLAVMAALEPDKSSRIGPGNVTGRAPTSRSAEQVAPVLSGHR
ncbi:hypothetical protein NOCD_16160 [Nocardioides cavernae]|jgi:hypothetical protein|uniref:hypothetical protein n=1 Tax=Nocardioides TaxID=1839 RepID=UPI0012E37D84|nr:MULTISPECIES: hypothetical protein [Nocardioides]MCK9825018.1 hypothetical protein [Nocardioides cavernae]